MSELLCVPKSEATIKLSGYDFNAIYEWLKSHEKDIGEHLDDYHDLEPLYVAIFGKAPRKYT